MPAVRKMAPGDGHLHDRREKVPVVLIRLLAALAPAPRQLHDEAIHVRLELLGRAVADAHRTRPAPAVELRQLDLRHAAFAVDGVEYLQLMRIARGGSLDEAPHARRLGLQPEVAQGMHGEDGVAQPAEAIIPVALAAGLLRQRGGRRRDDGARRGITERLQHDGRARDGRPAGLPGGRLPILSSDLRRPVPPPAQRLLVVLLRDARSPSRRNVRARTPPAAGTAARCDSATPRGPREWPRDRGRCRAVAAHRRRS